MALGVARWLTAAEALGARGVALGTEPLALALPDAEPLALPAALPAVGDSTWGSVGVAGAVKDSLPLGHCVAQGSREV